MPDSFPRVNRSLRADHAITSSCVLVAALALLTTWAVWALRATIPQYEVSTSARLLISPSGATQLLAAFPSAVGSELHSGEPAIFRPDVSASMVGRSLRARVSRIDGEVRNGQVQVEFSLKGAVHPYIERQESLPGSVEVEVQRVTPAALLGRSAGQLVGGR